MKVVQEPPTWEMISPAKATELLQTMTVNRKLSSVLVQRFAAAMQNGAWIESAGDPIRISQNGILIDGQHRLEAIAKSGKTIGCYILRDIPIEAMAVFDTGHSRTVADFLHIKGEKNALVLAGALQLLHVYRKNGLLVQPTGNDRLNAQGALDLLKEIPELRYSVTVTLGLSRAVRGGHSRWTAVNHILCSLDAEDTLAFLDGLERGEALASGSPILQLRERLLTSTSRRLPPTEYTALIFKAWNLYRDGRKAQYLSWKGGGASPEAYPKPH